MNKELKELTFLDMIKKVSSKDFTQDDLDLIGGLDDNPEDFFDQWLE